MKIENEQTTAGTIFYGVHFYPGVAQYDDPGKDSYRIFINEDTLRAMDPSFSGKPVFVEHVDDVDSNIDSLRAEADGWVIESFFNEADGKHWVKFIVVSHRGQEAIKQGFKLSNAYIPKLNQKPGFWNAVEYQQQVVGGEYEHLAIVRTPRYDESVILSPEKFKAYNEDLRQKLKAISNSSEKKMMSKIKFWNRKPADNSAELESISVTLPRSGKEFSISQLVNAVEEMEEKKKENMADTSAMVKLHDGKMCNVGELLEKYKEMSESKKENDESSESDLETSPSSVDSESTMSNEPSEDEKEKKKEVEEKKQNALRKRKENFDYLSNAHHNFPTDNAHSKKYITMQDQVELGRFMYGAK